MFVSMYVAAADAQGCECGNAGVVVAAASFELRYSTPHCPLPLAAPQSHQILYISTCI